MNKKAFTLVELIVVITILAILGTIGFISIQGYTETSRIAKKSSNLTIIYKKIELELIKGGSIHNYIEYRSQSSLGIGTGGTLSISGFAPEQNPSMIDSYKAGIIHYTNLKITPDSGYDIDFDNDFRVGAITYLGNIRYQLAGTIVRGGIQDSIIRGNYIPRYNIIATGNQVNYQKNPYILSRGIGASMTQGDTLITLNNQTYQELGWHKGDQLRIGALPPAGQELIITDLRNNNEITVDTSVTFSTGIRDIYISRNEPLHLISRRSSSNAPIEIGRIDDCCVPYNFTHPSNN